MEDEEEKHFTRRFQSQEKIYIEIPAPPPVRSKCFDNEESFVSGGGKSGAEELNMTISRASHLESLETFGINQFRDEAYRISRGK